MYIYIYRIAYILTVDTTSLIKYVQVFVFFFWGDCFKGDHRFYCGKKYPIVFKKKIDGIIRDISYFYS